MIVFVIFALINTFVVKHYILTILDIVAFFIFLVTFLNLRKTCDIEKSTYIAAVFLAVFMYLYVFFNQNNDFGLIWSISIPILAISILGHKKGLILSAIYYFLLFFILLYGVYFWEDPNWNMAALLRLMIASTVLVVTLFVTEYSLYNMHINMKILSNTDALTSLYNRRKIDEIIRVEYENFQRYDMELSLCILDIDNFKEVNDTYGHAKGDMVLKELADILKSNTRKTDKIGRWGGEEFIIIMPHTRIFNAVETIKKIQEKIKSYEFKDVGQITCSFGVTFADDKKKSIEKIFINADNKLYQAKRDGKDKIVS